jgi:hypothetical protein
MKCAPEQQELIKKMFYFYHPYCDHGELIRSYANLINPNQLYQCEEEEDFKCWAKL